MTDEATYAKSVQYTPAKNRWSQCEDTCNTVVLLLVLFGSVLTSARGVFTGWLGSSGVVHGVMKGATPNGVNSRNPAPLKVKQRHTRTSALLDTF